MLLKICEMSKIEVSKEGDALFTRLCSKAERGTVDWQSEVIDKAGGFNQFGLNGTNQERKSEQVGGNCARDIAVANPAAEQHDDSSPALAPTDEQLRSAPGPVLTMDAGFANALTFLVGAGVSPRTIGAVAESYYSPGVKRARALVEDSGRGAEAEERPRKKSRTRFGFEEQMSFDDEASLDIDVPPQVQDDLSEHENASAPGKVKDDKDGVENYVSSGNNGAATHWRSDFGDENGPAPREPSG